MRSMGGPPEDGPPVLLLFRWGRLVSPVRPPSVRTVTGDSIGLFLGEDALVYRFRQRSGPVRFHCGAYRFRFHALLLGQITRGFARFPGRFQFLYAETQSFGQSRGHFLAIEHRF